MLWGSLGAVLRFIPYIGSWIATLLPAVVALAVSPGWTMPLLTVALFVVIELVQGASFGGGIDEKLLHFEIALRGRAENVQGGIEGD